MVNIYTWRCDWSQDVWGGRDRFFGNFLEVSILDRREITGAARRSCSRLADGEQIGRVAFCSFGDESKDQIILGGGGRKKRKNILSGRPAPVLLLLLLLLLLPGTGKQPVNLLLLLVTIRSQTTVSGKKRGGGTFPPREKWNIRRGSEKRPSRNRSILSLLINNFLSVLLKSKNSSRVSILAGLLFIDRGEEIEAKIFRLRTFSFEGREREREGISFYPIEVEIHKCITTKTLATIFSPFRSPPPWFGLLARRDLSLSGSKSRYRRVATTVDNGEIHTLFNRSLAY